MIDWRADSSAVRALARFVIVSSSFEFAMSSVAKELSVSSIPVVLGSLSAILTTALFGVPRL